MICHLPQVDLEYKALFDKGWKLKATVVMVTAHECNSIFFLSIRFHFGILIWCRVIIWQVDYVPAHTGYSFSPYLHSLDVDMSAAAGRITTGTRNTEQPEREVKHPTVSWEGWRDGGGVGLKIRFLNSARCSNPIFCQNGPLTDPQLKSLENCHPARTSTDV